MKPEKIHDALNFLDDDIIEEAIKQRNKPKKSKIWLRYASLAACFCIVTVAAFAIYNKGGLQDENVISSQEQAENITEPQANGDGFAEAEGEAESVDSAVVPEIWDEAADIVGESEGSSGSHLADTAEHPSLRLKIISWQGDEFTAEVSGFVDTEIFPIGRLLRVTMDSRVSANSEKYPEGSIVEVMFNSADKVKGIINIESIIAPGG